MIPIQRLALRPSNDPYHQPKTAQNPRPAYSAHTFLKGCITTSGPDSYHYSGLRKYTPRELSLFQSFPYTYKFTGGMGEATKQIGNAFPPIMAEAMYRTIAKTLEAFDKQFIDAEDDLSVSDLDGILRRKGINMRSAPSFGRPLFEAPARTVSQPSRYFVRDENDSRGSATFTSSPFARNQAASVPQQPRVLEPMNLLDGLIGDNEEDNVRPSIETRPRHVSRAGSAIDDAIEVSSESEEESDSDDEESDSD